MSDTIVQIVYVSRATTEISESRLREIQRCVALGTENLRITGVLLYRSGMFFHFLEGPLKQSIDHLREIESAPYHSDLRIIISRVARGRLTEHWSMGVLNLDPIDESEEPAIPLLLDLAEHCPPEINDADALTVIDRMVDIFEGHKSVKDGDLAA